MGAMRVSREQIVSYRLQVNRLGRRTAFDDAGLRAASHAGVQDSMPRAAVLSLHARLEGVRPDVLDDPRLEQVWGPKFSAYVVASGDRAPFTLGRLPRRGARRERALRMADDLRQFLDGRTMTYAEAGRAMGVDPNALRYGTLTGTIVIRWEGSGRPTVTSVEAPDVDEEDARHELARRFLHVFGPAKVDDFGQWAGVNATEARTTFDELASEVVPVETPLGDAVVLARDETTLAHSTGRPEGVRLLPSGDALYLLWGSQRELFVADETRRPELWTPRVWPGALLVDGEIAGTWSRRGTKVAVDPWRTLTSDEQTAIDDEVANLPLP
ncbi:winged helix DNA-binding protein [Ilumatobacter fluminis]|uniref:Winged helix DNA-binding protein n=2 Tax=Ilumatobacter fluminis TaxID=467091 RepID=A0A4R7I406_9ACTN|nr:winged helix DNA-binding protein [Ilumatobacter fluminis]